MPEEMTFERPAGISADGEAKKIREIAGDDDAEKHAIGRAFNNIKRFKLHDDLGLSLEQFIDQHVLAGMKTLSASSLSIYGSIALNFSEDQAVRYGTSALRYFLAWRKVAGLPQLAPEDAWLQFAGEDGAAVEKSFADCSVSEIRAATRRLRARPTDRLSEEVVDLVESLQTALDGVLGPDHPSTIKVAMAGDAPVVSFEKLPVDRLPSILAALQAR